MVETVLRVRVCPKFLRKQPISAAGLSSPLSSRRPINPSPYIPSPRIRCLPHSPKPQIFPFKLKFSWCLFLIGGSKVWRAALRNLWSGDPRPTLAIPTPSSELQVLCSWAELGWVLSHVLQVLPASCLLHSTSNKNAEFLSSRFYLSLIATKFQQTNCRQLKNCGAPTIQILATQKNNLTICFLNNVFFAKKCRGEDVSGVPFLCHPSPFPFYITETMYPTVSPNCSKSVVIALLIRTSLSKPLGLSSVTVT